MHEPQFMRGCVARLDLPHLPEHPALLEMRHDGAQAVGALRVAAKLVLEVEGVVDVATRPGMVRRIVSEADSRLLESGRNDSQLRVRRPFCVPRIVIFLLQGRGTSFFPPPPPGGKTGGPPPPPRPAPRRSRQP